MDADVYIKSHELAWNAGWKAALDSRREVMDNDCKHGYYKLIDVETNLSEFRKYISFFCPDCGIRIPENL